MSKRIQLAIARPCHENWDTFASSAQGRFCGSCQKEVIDFTNWSDEQIKVYFRKSPSHTCGRFKEHQLKVYAVENGSFVNTWLSIGFASLALITSREASGQPTRLKGTVGQFQPDYESTVNVNYLADSLLTVSGTIYDEDGSAMPGVNVTRTGTSDRTVSDGSGKFTLAIRNPGAPETITFDFIGMETFVYSIQQGQPQEAVRIVMAADRVALSENIIVGGVCVHYPWYSPKRWWQGIKNLF